MNDELIDLKRITAYKGSKQVLKSVDWTTRRGEHWFILGNNGSGKSSLLEIVLGYLWPQSGEVKVLNERYGECYLPDVRCRIGFVAPWVIKRHRPSVPVYDVIASGLDASIGFAGPLSKTRQTMVKRQSKFFGCDPFVKAKFGVLSSGEQMRTVLARAMVNLPEILILDEPFAHLDIRSRAHLYELLNRLAVMKKGPQIILVTHYLEDIGSCFTHGLILKEGRAVLQGPRKKVLNLQVLAKTLDLPKAYGGF